MCQKAIRASKQERMIIETLVRALCFKNLEYCLLLMSILTLQLCIRVEELKRFIAKLSVQNTSFLTSVFAFNPSTRCSLQMIDA